MDLLDRLLAHDAWTTRQLLPACQALADEALDREFDIDQRTLRGTFVHLIVSLEAWTDLICERPVQVFDGTTIADLLARLGNSSRDLAEAAWRVAREGRYDGCFTDTLDDPPRRKTFGGAIGHVITHNRHHREQVMYLMERAGLPDHIEGDLLAWEAQAFGWR